MAKLLSVFILLLTGFGAVAPAWAFDYDCNVAAFGGVGRGPYKGVGSRWFGVPYVTFDSKYVFVRPPSAGVHLFAGDALELDARVDYLFWEFKPHRSSDPGMRNLDRRLPSMGAGMDAKLKTGLGVFKADFTSDVLGRSHSFIVTGAYTYPLVFARQFIVTPTVGVIWQNARHNDYYFGVSGEESLKSGLPAYDAGSGINYFARLGLTCILSRQMYAVLHGNYVWLPNAIKDSPMVDKTGTWGASGGIMYRF